MTALATREGALRRLSAALHEAGAAVLELAICEPEPGPRALAREPEVLLNVDQAAELLGCSTDTVRRLARRSRPCVRKVGRLVRYERAALLALVVQKGVER